MLRRMKSVISVFAASVLLISVTQVVAANIPQMISFQGMLRNGAGDPVPTGTYNVTFSLFPVPAGGTVLWSEVRSVAVTNGLFTVDLGTTVALDDSHFNSPDRYLGIAVSPDVEMSPRTRLISSAYAYRIATVDGANGGSLNGNLQISGKATIGPGNTNTGTNAFVAGQDNIVTGKNAVVGGGRWNRARGSFSVVGGGGGDVAGDSNSASGDFSIVGGGAGNIASGVSAFIGSGVGNTAGNSYTVVAGGDLNVAGAQQAAIVGGERNQAMGSYSFIGGGRGDTAYGNYSAIPGGYGNNAASYCFAAGRRACALHQGSFVWADSSVDSNFVTTANNQFLIRAKGGVGIGTPNPFTQLTMGGSVGFMTGTNPMIYMFQGGVSNAERPVIVHSPPFPDYGMVYRDIDDQMVFVGALKTNVLNIGLNTGKIGIGTATASQALHVVGNICATGTIGVCSDARFKTNVRPLTSALDRIERMRGVSFEWRQKDFPDHRFASGPQVGFLAQEVRDVLPEVVSEGSDGYLSVDYGRLTPVLVEAIKEQQKTIDELKLQVDALREQRRAELVSTTAAIEPVQSTDELKSLRAEVAALQAAVRSLMAQRQSGSGAITTEVSSR